MAPDNPNDIVIGIKFQIEEMKSSFAKIKSDLKRQVKDIQGQLAAVSSMPNKGFASQFGATKGEYTKFLKSELTGVKSELNGLGDAQKEALVPLNRNLLDAKKNAIKFNKDAKKGKREFAGWALSIMFFGMALKRVFDTIWKGSTKVFQDVSHSVQGTVTGFDMLNGSLDYLKYNIGQSLEPVVEFLVPIIDAVSNWVLNNQELVAGILVTVGVLGTMLTTIGMIKLAYDGFATAVGLLKLGELSVFAGLAAGTALLALVTLGGLAFKGLKEAPDAFDDFKSSTSDIKDSLLSIVDSLIYLSTEVIGVEVSWEKVGWMVAWVTAMIALGASNFMSYVQSMSAMGSMAVAVYRTLEALRRKDMKTVDEQSKKVKEAMDMLKESVAIRKANEGLMAPLLKGPTAYKEGIDAENDRNRTFADTNRAAQQNGQNNTYVYLTLDGQAFGMSMEQPIYKVVDVIKENI